MKNAVVCWTPYQLMNIINIVTADDASDYDLFILNKNYMTRYLGPIKKSKLFKGIFLYDDYSRRNYIFDRIIKIIDILFPNVCLKRKLKCEEIPDLSYSRIYASGWDKFFVSLVQVNKNAEIIMFEDGTVSYFGDFRDHEMPLSYKLLNRVSGKGANSVKVSKVLLNRPELLIGKYDCPVEKCCDFSELSKLNCENILNCGKKDEICYQNMRFVYFSQVLSEYKTRLKVEEAEIIKLLEKYKERTIVRLHPRQESLECDIHTDKTGSMWELIIDHNVTNDTVLIGFFSSAQFTPKILYDKEPVLIFIHRIVFDEKWVDYENAERFINKLKENYSNRIYIPNDLNDLAEVLSREFQEGNKTIS